VRVRTRAQPVHAPRLSLTRRALLGTLAASPALACTRIAELPLRLVDGFPVVTATLAGRPVSFVLDTGAQGMLVTPDTAAALALPLSGLTRVFGTGGSQSARVVRLPGLRLGGAAMPDLGAPVLPLPITLDVTPPLAGLLGASLLSRFDLELDVPAGRLALWTPGDCTMPRGTVLPMEVSRAGEAFVPVRINGQSLLALIDSGSRATILSDKAARMLGLKVSISLHKAPGVDGAQLPIGNTESVRLALGDEPSQQTAISIAPLQLDHGDMLLGLDQLSRRPVSILYGRGSAVFER
jgi:predicted aspartyl protease